MSTQHTLEADLATARTDLALATKHLRNMELATAHVLEERDHLRNLCVLLHDDTMRMQLEHDNEEVVLRDAVSRLRDELNIALDEQVRLLAQRRILAKHLRGLMYLARPAATGGWRLDVVPAEYAPDHSHGDVDFTLDPTPTPTILERISSWFRAITASLTTAA